MTVRKTLNMIGLSIFAMDAITIHNEARKMAQVRIVVADDTDFKIGPYPCGYQPTTFFPQLSPDLVHQAIELTITDGLIIPENCEIVILPRTPWPPDDRDMALCSALFSGHDPNRIFLLPRDVGNDMISSVQTIRVRSDRNIDLIDRLINKGEVKNKASIVRMLSRLKEVNQRMRELLSMDITAAVTAYLSHVIKHEFGHLLQHRYYPEVLEGSFVETGYFQLLDDRQIFGPGSDEQLYKEGIAEDFVQSLSNAYLPNAYCLRDVVDKLRAERGRTTVAKLITTKKGLQRPVVTQPAVHSSPDLASGLIVDINPFLVLQDNLDRIDEDMLERWAMEMEADVEDAPLRRN